MNHQPVEYIWIDADGRTRGKTKVVDTSVGFPEWEFDGSSTRQAIGTNSDIILRPVYSNFIPFLDRTVVLCATFNRHGSMTESNIRLGGLLREDEQYWFGFEQEYFLIDPKTELPLGLSFDWKKMGYYSPLGEQGPYYCGVGAQRAFGRQVAESHFNACLEADIPIVGMNAEVAPGQWEYQLLGKGGNTASDQLWVSRYLLCRVAESFGLDVSFDPKPVAGDWNGSGMHTNFSNTLMREGVPKQYFRRVIDILSRTHESDIKHYGVGNDSRLTGNHETCSISEFRAGESDRGASIRIPVAVTKNPEDNWMGYLEDRRPAANANPYAVTSLLINNMNNTPL